MYGREFKRPEDGLVDVEKLRENLLIGAPRRGWRLWQRRKNDKGEPAYRRVSKSKRAIATRKREYSSKAGMRSIQSVAVSFRLWLQDVEKHNPISEWDVELLKDLRREMMPMRGLSERVDGLLAERVGAGLNFF